MAIARGFTVLELTVALSISGIVVLGAGAAVLSLSGLVERLEADTSRTDAAMNGERVLRRLTSSVRLVDDSASVEGDASHVLIRTWCQWGSDILEPCVGELTVIPAEVGASVQVRLDSGGPSLDITLIQSATSIEFRFLRDASHGGQWVETWVDGTAPLALGVDRGGDILILPLGSR